MLKVILCLNVLVAVGGVSDPVDKPVKPFVIARNGVPKCAGVAVGKRELIATAAHCVYGVSKSKLTVVSGSTKNGIKRVIVHPYYNPPSPDYDIALLKMEEKPNSVLSLWKDPSSENNGLEAITWNLTGKEIKLVEKPTEATLEDRKSCRAKMSSHVVLSSRMLCAVTKSDSLPDGRVLLMNNKVFGIGSYYVKGADDTLPKIFTNIENSEISSFIDKYTTESGVKT